MSERSKLNFDFNWKLTLCVVFVFGSCVKLSLLQIDKAIEKKRLQQAWSEQQGQPLVQFVADKKYPNYQKVQLTGFFIVDKFWLVENQTYDSQLGYRVIMPFELDSGAVVAIDRGWIQGSPLDEWLPNVETTTAKLQIFGVIVDAKSVKMHQEVGAVAHFWPRKISELDLVLMRAQSGIALYDRVVHLDEHSPSALLVSWRPFDVSAAMHYGYAFRWGLMAIAILFLYLCIAFKVLPVLCGDRRRDINQK